MEKRSIIISPITRNFTPLLAYKDDVDLLEKLSQWEHFYNLERPNGEQAGKTPHEVL